MLANSKAARNTLNVTMGDTWARGDLNTINLHFATTKNGVGADLVYESAAPPTRFGGSGMWFFDPSLTRFSKQEKFDVYVSEMFSLPSLIKLYRMSILLFIPINKPTEITNKKSNTMVASITVESLA